MAFATANVKSSVFGNLKVLVGDWTGAVGDAPGTVAFGGGRVWLANFVDEGGDQPYQVEIPISVSTSGTVTTVTVYNQGTVTAGRFILIGG